MVKKPSLSRKAAAKKAALKTPAQPEVPSPSPSTSLQTPVEQQRLLNIFADAFGDVLSSDRFPALLQELKQALFNRDFAAAFGREDYLEAYAARWSPTRALGYAAVFLSIRRHLNEIVEFEDGGQASEAVDAAASTSGEEVKEIKETASPLVAAGKGGRLRMVCIGGCAAEHVAFSSYIQSQDLAGRLTLVDSGPWSSVSDLLEAKITSPPPLSKYASAAAKASNQTALLRADQVILSFAQDDILALEDPALAALLGDKPVVLTLMFTLNELYTRGGIAKTTVLLKTVGQVLAGGSLLLVVDSPGSYSEAAVGKEKKKYPMQWLLDHTLLETASPGYKWDKVESQESSWFRLPEDLHYPIQLENMRYQLHLYRLEK
ncbi:hypothetical protein B0J13DRAFT_311828 [Dactylonectria estremocensis]|uniref:25S rRNA (Uridine(2843)-N(3))-methyltransferase n=1 Tax=Dactylonectria estremocensis TaxID=1079267 RepID=A0A9P9J654_9HYPO|nr:hypothetical protein B0J13DRAFT_311828 [Dactylonectria estremocensis]